MVHLALSGVTSRDVSENDSPSIVKCYMEGRVRERFTRHCQVLHQGTCQRTIHAALSGVTLRDVWPEFREMFHVVHGNLRSTIFVDMEFSYRIRILCHWKWLFNYFNGFEIRNRLVRNYANLCM